MWHYILITFGLCFCLIIITSNKKTNQITSTSIEVNFIDTKEFTTKINTSNDVKSEQKNVASAKNKKKVHIPKFMFDLYEKRRRDDYDYNCTQPDIVRSVIPKNAGTFPNKSILKTFEENHILEFDIPSSNQEETFFNAELRILTLINPNKTTSGVERFIRVSAYNESTNTLILLHERHVFHTDNTWITFNLTKLVDELFRKYLKLVISVKVFCPFLKYNGDHFKLSLLPSIEDIEHDYPILLLSYLLHSGEKSRKKRSAEEDYEEESNRIWDNEQQNKVQSRKLKRLRNTCKRKQLYIDFAEIHYDSWIVQPSGYEAYQCTGKCFYPVADHLSPTKHAIVQALMHSVAPSRATRSCCVPSKLDSISLLYVDERGVPTYRYGYNDMVVVECGCR